MRASCSWTAATSSTNAEIARRHRMSIGTIVPIDIRCRRAISALSHAIPAIHQHDARILRIRAQRVAAVREKREHPLPLVIGAARHTRASSALRRAARRLESAAERDRHDVLREDVERTFDRQPRLDRRTLDAVARRRHFEQFQRVRRHARHPAHRARAGGRCVPRAAATARRPSDCPPAARDRPARNRRRDRAKTSRRRSAAVRRACRSRPIRAVRGPASRGAARSFRPSRAARRASPDTRSPFASACW